MSMLKRALFCLLLAALTPGLPALEATPAPLRAELVSFAAPEGWERLLRSTAKSDFAALANQFEPQATNVFCGPASAAIVLNALAPASVTAPRDQSRLRPEDTLYLRSGAMLAVQRHTQESVIAAGPKTRAQVFGQPVERQGRTLRDAGYQLRQFDALLQAHGAATRLVVVDAAKTVDEVRRDFAENLARPGDFVIVNYQRGALGQPGGGHISPLAAYDAASDSVLVMDVNPSQHPWAWVPLDALVAAMRTRDHEENRGYVLVRPR